MEDAAYDADSQEEEEDARCQIHVEDGISDRNEASQEGRQKPADPPCEGLNPKDETPPCGRDSEAEGRLEDWLDSPSYKGTEEEGRSEQRYAADKEQRYAGEPRGKQKDHQEGGF